jgi:hypothetical protein
MSARQVDVTNAALTIIMPVPPDKAAGPSAGDLEMGVDLGREPRNASAIPNSTPTKLLLSLTC